MPFEKVSALSQVTFNCARHPYLRASVTILDFILLNSTISRDELDRRIPVSCDAALRAIDDLANALHKAVIVDCISETKIMAHQSAERLPYR